jgi:ubiquinone/menaquinone biosynthesis C-methylase UbiE
MDSMKSYAKPDGIEGEELLDSMDIDHSPRALWSLDIIPICETDVVVDIGCGSGLNVKRLHEKSSKAKTYGVDYSRTSVKKSIQTNEELIEKGCIEIVEANVLDMPFENNKFDIATAFSTIFFWPDIVNSFKEVKRILKDDGKFIMVHGMTINDESEEVDDEYFTSYSNEDIKKILHEAGYSKITIITRNHAENKRIIKTYDDDFLAEEVVADYITGKIPPNQEWTCIIAEK